MTYWNIYIYIYYCFILRFPRSVFYFRWSPYGYLNTANYELLRN